MSVPCPKPFSPLDLLQLGNQLAKYTGPTNQVTYARVGKSRSGNSTLVLLLGTDEQGQIHDLGSVYVPNNRGITIYRYLNSPIRPDPHWTLQLETHNLEMTIYNLTRLPVPNLTKTERAQWEFNPCELPLPKMLFPFTIKELL